MGDALAHSVLPGMVVASPIISEDTYRPTGRVS